MDGGRRGEGAEFRRSNPGANDTDRSRLDENREDQGQ